MINRYYQENQGHGTQVADMPCTHLSLQDLSKVEKAEHHYTPGVTSEGEASIPSTVRSTRLNHERT